MQRMGSLCSQEFKQSRLSLISLLWFAPWHVPTQHRSFPKLNVMSASSSSPFIPRIAVTLVSLSHAIRCLQAAHVPMQVPADGAEKNPFNCLGQIHMGLVFSLPPNPTMLQTVTQCGIPAHLHPYGYSVCSYTRLLPRCQRWICSHQNTVR